MADIEKASAREPSLRDRVTTLEKAMYELREHQEEADAQVRRLTREVGIDE